MATTKVTFTLDDETVRVLRAFADRQRKPQSLVVREAIAAYANRETTLPDDERDRRLAVLDRLDAQPPTRTEAEVDRELRQLRRLRRAGWRRRQDA